MLDLWFKQCFIQDMEVRDPILSHAIKSVGASGDLAAQIGISPQALSQWKRVPPLRVLDVERVTGISRHDLRPDLYPRDHAPTPAQEAAS